MNVCVSVPYRSPHRSSDWDETFTRCYDGDHGDDNDVDDDDDDDEGGGCDSGGCGGGGGGCGVVVVVVVEKNNTLKSYWSYFILQKLL